MNERTAEFLSEYAAHFEKVLTAFGFAVKLAPTETGPPALGFRAELTRGPNVYAFAISVRDRDAFVWGSRESADNKARARRYARYAARDVIDSVISALDQ